MRSLCLAGCFAALLSAQIGPSMAPNGSITGTVTDASSGAPLPEVMISAGDVKAMTDSNGRFKLTALSPGSYRLTTELTGRTSFHKYVHINSGEAATLDVRIEPEPSLSGRVTDENQQPVGGMTVMLLRSEYQGGRLRRVVAGHQTTRADGIYIFSTGLESGREYQLLATRLYPDATQPDRAVRKAVARPTYYPESANLGGAIPVTLQPGERRDGVNIRMPNFKPLCVDGTVTVSGKPAAASIRLHDDEVLGLPPVTAASGADGRYSICGLAPGNYSAVVSQTTPRTEGIKNLGLNDADQHRFDLEAVAAPPAVLQVAWDSVPPEGMRQPHMTLTVANSTGQNIQTMERSFPYSGPFFAGPSGDYKVRATFGDGLYVKRMTYGGIEVLQGFVKFNSAGGEGTLRIEVGRDGSLLSLTVNDSDGHPVPLAPVLLFPDSATSVPLLAAHMVVGYTDANGVYRSPTVAPGHYSVMAILNVLKGSPEELRKLFDARSRAQSVDLTPRNTTTLTIQPVTLE